MADNELFRKEAIEATRKKLWGDVVLAQPPSLVIWTAVVLFATGTILSFLVFGTYVRKETVQGYLTPKDGIIQVYGPSLGKITRIMVQEGDHVVAGQPVFALSGETLGADTGRVLDAQLTQIQEQIQSAQQRSSAARSALTSDETRIEQQLESQIRLTSFYAKRHEAQASIIAISGSQLEKYEQLRTKGYVADSTVLQLKQQILSQEEGLNDIEQQQNSNAALIKDLRAQLATFPDKNAAAGADANAELSVLAQRRIDLSASRSLVEPAPVSGTVSDLQAKVGQSVHGNLPLISLMPDGSSLEAELLIPTRAAGFIKVGDEARLQISAYPFERYGFVTGRVITISNSVMQPGDMLVPVNVPEAVYRVRVSLDRSFVIAYATKHELKPGMLLIADVVLDRRKLWQQLLDPLISAAKRSH